MFYLVLLLTEFSAVVVCADRHHRPQLRRGVDAGL